MSATHDGDAPDDAGTDRTIGSVAVAIAVIAALFALSAVVFTNTRVALGVVIGGAAGVANFLVLARIGKAVTGSRSGAAFWGAIYFVKLAVLFGGIYLVFTTGVINVYGLLVGLSAIVPGIVVGGVVASSRQAR